MAGAHPNRHLRRAKDVADVRYADRLTVADLAKVAGLSPAHFSREFRAAFGEPPHRYLLTRRLERAAALLRMTDWSVARICTAVGLSGIGSFTTSFGRAFGMTPTAYRNSFPPSHRHVRLPLCAIKEYGRPRYSTNREDNVSPSFLSSGHIPRDQETNE